jgi:hypothetical protein
MAASLARVPICGEEMVTMSPGARAASWVAMMPVPVSRTEPAGTGLARRRYSIKYSILAAEFGGGDGAVEDEAFTAADGAGHIDVVGVGEFIGGDEPGAEGAAAGEDLGLGQIEGVFAFDIPGGDIVGEAVAEDFALGAEQDGEFGFGGGEGGVLADADLVVGSDADAGVAFEEDFGARGGEDVFVEALARAVFGVAEGGAHFVGAAAGPDLAGADGHDGGEAGGAFGAALGDEIGEVGVFALALLDQFEHGVAGDGPGLTIFKEGRGDAPVPIDLSNFHSGGSCVSQYLM